MTQVGIFRGGLQVGNVLYGAWTDHVFTIDSSGTLVQFGTGTLSGTDQIFMVANNALVPNIVAVTQLGAFIINQTTNTITTYPDPDVGSPSCVCFHEGWFMFGYGDGTILASDINSTNINTLNQAATETNPDGVMNMVSYQGNLFVFGSKTVEIWGLPVNATDFPLTRIGYNMTPGLHSQFAVSGWEAEFGNPPIYVGSDNSIRQIQGFTPVKISPPELDALIAGVALNRKIDTLCYVARGHAFWQVNGPDFSWVFDCNNQSWHERRSIGSPRSNLLRSIAAFDRWLCATVKASDLLTIDYSIPTESGHPLVCQMESQNVIDWPNRMRVGRADFNFTTGVGLAAGTDPIQTDPTVLIEWSDDGGQSWSGPWWRKLGVQDATQQRITVLNTGRSGPMGRKWRWTISDPVWVGFLGSSMNPEVRQR